MPYLLPKSPCFQGIHNPPFTSPLYTRGACLWCFPTFTQAGLLGRLPCAKGVGLERRPFPRLPCAKGAGGDSRLRDCPFLKSLLIPRPDGRGIKPFIGLFVLLENAVVIIDHGVHVIAIFTICPRIIFIWIVGNIRADLYGHPGTAVCSLERNN